MGASVTCAISAISFLCVCTVQAEHEQCAASLQEHYYTARAHHHRLQQHASEVRHLPRMLNTLRLHSYARYLKTEPQLIV